MKLAAEIYHYLPPLLRFRKAAVVGAICCFCSCLQVMAQPGGRNLELTRAVRPWEFVSALGTRSGLLGNESGDFEAWVYPLKILRNFHLRFKVEDQTLEGNALARSISVRPESTTITYTWDTFSVRETLFAPVDDPGAVIALEIDSAQPLKIEAAFERDFQLQWPGAMGGSDIEWVPALHAFSMTENQQKFSALVGSPSATEFQQEYVTNYTAGKENALGFGVIPAGRTTKLIVVAASFDKLPPAEVTYKKLVTNYQQLLDQSAAYYQNYLQDHVGLELPDIDLQQAYEWAQVSMLQGLVTNPYLGTGLVAGYRASGEDQRPGYAWFFGRDALWTSLGLDVEGDFATTRKALEFLGKYQRADGKVTHEIAQGASFVPWFESMPYAYASADATPLLIIATNDYVRRSGDAGFASEHWSNLWRAYQFIASTYDKEGLPRNEGVGHGWIEGGPLYPAESELYQTAVVVEALRSLAALAKVLGKADVATSLTAEYERKKLLINDKFWLSGKSHFALALDRNGQPSDTLSVLGAVPMWFGLLDDEKATQMILQLSQPDIATDWGMRIIPTSSPKYDTAGYHSGTVWPLFTGWASVGEYRYHQAFPAYENLRANAMLTFGGSLGHVAEVLTGNYYQTLATGSPHQIWSSSMVVSSFLNGLFDIDANATENHVSLTPHIPATWTFFKVKHLQAGSCLIDINYRKAIDKVMFEVINEGARKCDVTLSPALSLRSQVVDVELNGRAQQFHIERNQTDQHVNLRLEASTARQVLTLHLKNDFGLSQDTHLPALGSTNEGMRVISETWTQNRDRVTLLTSSAMGGTFKLDVWNPEQIVSVEGATLDRSETGEGSLDITIPQAQHDTSAYQTVVLHFIGEGRVKPKIDISDPAPKGKSSVH